MARGAKRRRAKKELRPLVVEELEQLQPSWHEMRAANKWTVSPSASPTASTCAGSTCAGSWAAKTPRWELPEWGEGWDMPAEHGTFCGAVAELLGLVDAAAEPAEQELSFVWPELATGKQRQDWVLDVTRRLNYTLPAVVLSVHYISKLIQARRIAFHPSTWRALWFTAVTVADRVVEDDFMQEKYVRQVMKMAAPGVSKDAFRDMQFALLRWLDFKVDVSGEEFTELVADLHEVDPVHIPCARVCIERNCSEVEFSLADLYLPREPGPVTRAKDLCDDSSSFDDALSTVCSGVTSPAASPASEGSPSAPAPFPFAKALQLCAARDVLAEAIPGTDFVQVLHDLLGDFTPAEYQRVCPIAASGRSFTVQALLQVYGEQLRLRSA